MILVSFSNLSNPYSIITITDGIYLTLCRLRYSGIDFKYTKRLRIQLILYVLNGITKFYSHFFMLQPSALSRMASLRTLSLSPYAHVHDYNVPEIIQQNTGLRNLHIQVKIIMDITDLAKDRKALWSTKNAN